jgi:predicted cupin superfamily sugar epimerase
MPNSLSDRFMESAEFWIEKLQLKAHPEGGFYTETYRSSERIDKDKLPSKFNTSHSISTAIYFLLRSEDISAFHRIKSDELWFFHAGSPVEVYFLTKNGVQVHCLGSNINEGQDFQLVVPADTWFGAKVTQANSYVLVSCTVAPGFEFEDFELGRRHDLLEQYPSEKSLIESLTYDK